MYLYLIYYSIHIYNITILKHYKIRDNIIPTFSNSKLANYIIIWIQMIR